MVDLHASLFHHLFEVPVAERIGEALTYADQNVSCEAVSFEVDHVNTFTTLLDASLAYRKREAVR